MKKGVILLIVLFCTFTALAQNDVFSMKLLAVQEDNGTYKGSDANLYLEIKDGTGRVFLDTFPLTKMDTQISTRYAKDIACNHFKLDCDNHDFIYTIKASSNIIGGPSAGAAIAALTSIAILGLNHDEDVTITGTINSGGIIGPVGGVKEKLRAASDVGLDKVLIAKGTGIQVTDEIDNETNESIEFDLIEYGKENLSLEVVEVMDLDDVVFHLTGVQFNDKDITITENEEYTQIMKDVKGRLCARAKKIDEEIWSEGLKINETLQESIDSKLESAENTTNQKDYYSAASFCLSASILLRQVYYQENKATLESIAIIFAILEKKIASLELRLDEEEIETISDLQTHSIVKERLSDAKNQIKIFNEENLTLEEIYPLLAYAEERYFTSIVWMEFFAMEGKKFSFDKETLHESCHQKIIESEERAEYARIFLGDYGTSNIRDKIEIAKSAMNKEEYVFCLIKASQAKAEASAVMSSMGLSEKTFPDYIQSKAKAVSRVIEENTEEGMFPILGYSYYKYAQSLQDEQKYTAIVFLEYALEMSELSIYFPEKGKFFKRKFVLRKEVVLIVEGFIMGVLAALVFMFLRNGRKRRIKKKETISKDSNWPLREKK